MIQSHKFRCVIHGSFRKHFDLIQRAYQLFTEAGIEVLAPKQSEIVSINNGFTLFEGEENMDQRLVELMYLHNLKRLSENGLSYFINPEGYIGKSASYELGIAQLSNTRCFYYSELEDHPAYVHKNAIWSPEDLVAYILEKNTLKTVRFNKFQYDFSREKSEIDVKMAGQASSYTSLALQAAILGSQNGIISPVFSNLDVDNKGRVTFDLDFSVDPKFMLYEENLVSLPTS